jgi:hypothetical protein
MLDAAGPRAVRAKVLAEVSAVCPDCGLRHLLDSQCSGPAADEVHETEPSLVAPLATASADEAPATQRAVERGDARIRQLVGSLLTYFGLDPASFGEVDESTPSPAPATATAKPVTPVSRPSMRRLISFLGFDVGAGAFARDAPRIAAPPTASTQETEPLLGDQIASAADSPTDVESADTERVAATANLAPQPWSRGDDDILYRRSRRPRSPRRAWRDRVSSRG